MVACALSGDPYRASAHGHLGKIHVKASFVSAYGPGSEGNGIKAALLQRITDLIGDERIACPAPKLRISSDKEQGPKAQFLQHVCGLASRPQATDRNPKRKRRR